MVFFIRFLLVATGSTAFYLSSGFKPICLAFWRKFRSPVGPFSPVDSNGLESIGNGSTYRNKAKPDDFCQSCQSEFFRNTHITFFIQQEKMKMTKQYRVQLMKYIVQLQSLNIYVNETDSVDLKSTNCVICFNPPKKILW